MRAHPRQARDETDEGATAVEYGLMVAVIAVVIMVILAALGDRASSTVDCGADSEVAKTDTC